MGLGKLLGKSIKQKPSVFIAEATLEQWKKEPAESIQAFLTEFIEKVKAEHPLYTYARSTFDYTHDGNIVFRLRMELKQFKGALSISHKRR